MDLIVVKEKGVELPNEKNVRNCIKYNKTYSVAFARNNVITVLKDLTEDDYEVLINFYELTKDDPIMFCFQGYYENKLGNMPLVLAKKQKKYSSNKFETNKPIIAFADSVLGVEEENKSIDEFLFNVSKFDRKQFSDIANLAFGDNLVAILNTDGTFETYGLELTTLKKWKKCPSGIMYTDDDYISKNSYTTTYTTTYNTSVYNYNSEYYGNNYYDYEGYEYHDQNTRPYSCDCCHNKSGFVIVIGDKQLCNSCYKKTKE